MSDKNNESITLELDSMDAGMVRDLANTRGVQATTLVQHICREAVIESAKSVGKSLTVRKAH